MTAPVDLKTDRVTFFTRTDDCVILKSEGAFGRVWFRTQEEFDALDFAPMPGMTFDLTYQELDGDPDEIPILGWKPLRTTLVGVSNVTTD